MRKKIKVGVIHSLSGTMSFSESPLVDATLMAIDEINQSGGVLDAEVKPIVEDCASDAETYGLNATRLIKRDGISHFFGCWTSASRKAVKPIVEAHNALLWYPVQYEGLEESPNIVYTGNCLNQQIEPAVEWSAQHLGRKCYLVGSDYVFPKTANKLIRTLCSRSGMQIVGEHYLPLGAENFQRIVEDIIQKKPDVVFNTINGDSNIAFYYFLNRSGNKPERIPVMAFSIGEVELKDIGPSAVGHYVCSGYFQCLDTPENMEFIRRFKNNYGQNRVVSDPVVSAYLQPFLWKRLVEKCNTFNVTVLKKHIAGIAHKGPSGTIELHTNHHAIKPAMIGKVNPDLQFDLIWQQDQWIEPLPWLGLEKLGLAAREMIKDALAAFPEALDFEGKLNTEVEKRKQAELDLKKEKSAVKNMKASYQALLNAIPAGVVIVDASTGMIHDCNPWFEDLIGKSRSVLRKQCFWELAPVDQWDSTRRQVLDTNEFSDTISRQVVFCRADGRETVCRIQNSQIKINGKSMFQCIIHSTQQLG
jgi:urea transport system substrate-binding protein